MYTRAQAWGNEWEYRESEVILGSKYENLEKDKSWSISLRRDFRVVKCSSFLYDVKSIHVGCPWRVHASKGG
jgi:hypothetical protein